MNKDELIAILQKRSQENFNDDEVSTENQIESKYLSKLKFRREEDKKRYRLLVVIFLLILIICYLLFKNFTKVELTDPNYIHKSEITYNDLPSNLRDNYISKDEIELSINKAQKENKEKIISLEKEVIKLNKIIEEKESQFGELTFEALVSKSKNYEATGCYIMNKGDYNLYDSCQSKLVDFFKEIKSFNARSFEVIAIMDGNDRTFVNQLVNMSNVNSISKEKLKNVLLEGIARNRILAAKKYLKKKLGKKTIITHSSYIAYTANKRGFTLRAYR